MNQDQIKKLLLSLEDTSIDFSVTMTGKQSRKVNGLYKPETREILLHNKNFETDNQLIYTAIHEYAHHLHCEAEGPLRSPRSHGSTYWARFHGLLAKAEVKGIYTIGTEGSPALEALTEEIRSKYLAENGRLMKDLGVLLVRAQTLCKEAGVRYEDWIDRVLCLPRTAAKQAVRIGSLDIRSDIGYEAMKIVASQRTPEDRIAAQRQFVAHKSPDEVRVNVGRKMEEDDHKTRLEKERRRLEKTIAQLNARLQQVEKSLAVL